MDKLDLLLKKRDDAKDNVKLLTKEIMSERSRISEERKKAEAGMRASSKSYNKLQKENSRLRSLIAFIKKSGGATNKEVGEMLGVSATRAGQLIAKQERIFNFYLLSED